MAADKIIKIRISADGTAAVEGIGQVSASLNKFSATASSAASSSKSVTDSISSHWVALTGAIAGAYLTIKQVVDAAMIADKFQDQMGALDMLGQKWGATADLIVQKVTDASHGIVSASDAANIASKQMLAGMSPDQVSQMTVVSERLAEVWGTDVAGAMEILGNAALTGKDKMLKKLGVTLDLNKAYEDFALKAGTTVERLDDETKKWVGMQVILGKTQDILGVLPKYQDDVGKGIDRMSAAAANAKLAFGNTLLGAMQQVYDLMVKYPVVSSGVAAGLITVGIACTTASAAVLGGLVPALGKAVTAMTAATFAMMKNPVVLAFAAAVAVAAGAFAYFKTKADAAKAANDAYVEGLKKGGIGSVRDGVAETAAELEKARQAQAAWNAEYIRLTKEKKGGREVSDARDAVAAWAEKVRELEARYKSASDTERLMSKSAEEDAKKQKDILDDIAKANAKAEAQRLAREREALENSMRDDLKKPVAEAGGRDAAIEAEAQARRQKGVDEQLLNQWVADQKVKSAAKAHEEIEAFIRGEEMSEIEKLERTLEVFRANNASELDIERARQAGEYKIKKEYDDKYNAEQIRAADEIRKIEDNATMASLEQRARFEENDARRRAGHIGEFIGAAEAEVIRIRYEGERRITEEKIRQAQVGLEAAGREMDIAQERWIVSGLDKDKLAYYAAANKYEAESLRVLDESVLLQREIEESKRNEAYELNDLMVSKTKELVDMKRELNAMSMQERADKIQRGMSPLQELSRQAGPASGPLSDLAGNISQLAMFSDNADPYSQELERLDAFYSAKREKIIQAANAEQQALAAAHQIEIQALEARNAQAQELEDARARYAESRAQSSAIWQSQMIATYNEKEMQDKWLKTQQSVAIVGQGFSAMANMAASYYELSGKQSRIAFEAWKAFAIAQTIIDTYRAAQGAFASLAGIPVVGVGLAVAAAAAAIAAGMARVQAIRNTHFGGGGGGTGGGEVQIPTMPTPDQMREPDKPEKPTTQQTINIHVYAEGSLGVDEDSLEQFARKLVNPLNKAISDGVR